MVLRVNPPLIYLVLWLGQSADLCGLVGHSTDISIWSCRSVRGYQYLVLLVNPLVCLVLWVNPLICLVLSGPVGQSADMSGLVGHSVDQSTNINDLVLWISLLIR